MDVLNITLEEIIKKYASKYRPKISCDYCKKKGHIEKYCWRKQRKEITEMKCYKCGQKGHKMKDCENSIENNINNQRKQKIMEKKSTKI